MQDDTITLGFHGATTMTADLQTDVQASAHAGFKTPELWADKVDRFLAEHSVEELKALSQGHRIFGFRLVFGAHSQRSARNHSENRS